MIDELKTQVARGSTNADAQAQLSAALAKIEQLQLQ